MGKPRPREEASTAGRGAAACPGAEGEGRQLPAAGCRSRSGAGSDSRRSSLASGWVLAAGPASAQWRGSATNEAPPAPGAPLTSRPAAKAAPPSGRRRVGAAGKGDGTGDWGRGAPHLSHVPVPPTPGGILQHASALLSHRRSELES